MGPSLTDTRCIARQHRRVLFAIGLTLQALLAGADSNVPEGLDGTAQSRHPERAHFGSSLALRWSAEQRNGVCVLALPVASYGEARFVAVPEGVVFELAGDEALLAPTDVALRTLAPPWHPRYPYAGRWQSAIHVPGYGVQLVEPESTRLLMDFFEGYQQQLGANPSYGGQPSVLITLSVLYFRAAYEAFVHCRQGDRPSGPSAMRRLRVTFTSGHSSLHPPDLRALDAFARYVVSDPRIARIFVDGHTDDVGTAAANLALSKRRANTVAGVLRKAGVEPALLRVRYHGERYPVQAATTDRARARNRRVTLRVELASAGIAAPAGSEVAGSALRHRPPLDLLVGRLDADVTWRPLPAEGGNSMCSGNAASQQSGNRDRPMKRKIVLSYSGGLDTSVICRWLQEVYDADVVTFTADIGQGEEVEPARAKAQQMGVREIFIEDQTEEFVRDFVFPMFRANTVYEGEYLLGTSIARPLITKRLVEIAEETGADAIAHGATGKGNDQVRFELGAYALNPDIQVIAPWREWDLNSREALMAFCESHQIPVDYQRGTKSPYSMDANLLHISYEGGGLEDPDLAPDESMWRWTVAPEQAPDEPLVLELTFAGGDPVAIDGVDHSPAELLRKLNELGGAHGVGRSDIVENRYVGMKSRGCYETPGGTVLLKAHRAIESITLDREVTHLKDEMMPRYATLIYNGYWWSPERKAVQALIDQTQHVVNGVVRVKLYKGSVSVLGRRSDGDSLYDANIVTFEDDAGAYDQTDASGFIRLNALRLRLAAARGRSLR